MDTTLIIMAAGIGSRYGAGIKQLAKMGPNGEIIMDYSIRDAKEAGFNKVVFIIRKDIFEEFEEIIGSRIKDQIDVEYVFQELDDLPEGFEVPEGRTKPWGTGQAVLCCKDIVKEPFVIINADDYYGKEAFVKLHDFLVSGEDLGREFTMGMAGFILKNTLSDNGTVTRGVSVVDENGLLSQVHEKSNEESEINGLGPVIHDDELEQMFKKLDELEDGDILVLAGSIPATLPSDVYERIMGRLQGKDIRIVVDATKDLLLNVLKYHPFLIKPNNYELGEMFDVVLKTNDEIVEYAKKLQEKGARNVLVSMAGDGAILITEEGEVHVTPCPKGEVKNSVGAGDSMVAGFITGYLRSNGDYNEALKMGTAAGSATAFSEDVATGEKIMKLYKTL